MKTLLVPIDFSEPALNAMRYAAGMAMATGAGVTLLHAYHVPVPANGEPMAVLSADEIEAGLRDQLQKLEREIQGLTSGKVQVRSEVRAGFAVEEILDASKQHEVDLIVMGITGAGRISRALLGSNSASVLRKAAVPVLIVPAEARFSKIKTIVLAYDYSKPLPAQVVDRIKGMAELFSARLLVLDVVRPQSIPTMENAVAGVQLENSFRTIEHQLYFPASDDVIGEISAFSGKHQADLLIMLPHRHTLLSRLFQPGNTRQMAFHTHLPLLSLHE
ncbi:MAG: universal stress protein [Bacteroidota bacterium]